MLEFQSEIANVEWTLISQDFLQHINDENIFELLSGTINLRETRDARLAFECIRFLCGLFCHKKICLEWVTNGGVQLLIDVPQPSIGKFFKRQGLKVAFFQKV